ncbi:hypothetical protein Pmani_017509 [Petrolisthes manimaculis]|uniref:Uncharacterized protein n=1 Tax=Petrolisthes manimaculis TaxID=1843537 RepID=A0AAE1U5D8_9EUCA|nr:hypothetical protein Pmani_017509 [Petrolisthes manimaculis]
MHIIGYIREHYISTSHTSGPPPTAAAGTHHQATFLLPDPHTTMASWISLALLSAITVSALSLPDESAYRIPQVGTGRRSQYYVLHQDGTYKYGHDTGEGAFESARSVQVGRQDGEFGYQDPDGNVVTLQYEAGEGGFRPSGSHIPQPHPEFFAAHAEARARPPFVDPLANTNTDASYDFNFAEGGQARQEVSDADGNVRGSYTYTDEEGRTRTYNYVAGRNTGFVITGDDLPEAPLAPGATPAATSLSAGAAAASSAFRGSSSATAFRPSSSSTGASSAFSGSSSASAFRGSSSASAFRPSSSSTGATSPFRSSSSASTTGFTSSRGRPSHTLTRSSTAGAGFTSHSETRPDGSYSFTYDAGDHDRSESGDANLNVDGQFSFVADDGVRRQVTYEAGSDTGFVASGDHLPKAPADPHASTRASSRASTFHRTSAGSRPSSTSTHTGFSSSRPSSTSTHTGFSSSRPSTHTGFSSSRPSSTHTGFSSSRPSSAQTRFSSTRPDEVANTRSSLNPDGSYAFAYETSSHSRAEAGDSSNNVDGEFDFVADDGQERGIKYEAGSDTGFIAEGAHIPVGPPVPGAPSGQPTGRIVPVQEVPFIDPLADSNTDASYSFGFESEQYSRTESADADGNVQGTYTVVDDDGTRRTYRFRAGQGVGYEAEEVSSTRGAAPSKAAAQAGATSFFNNAAGVSTSHTGGVGAGIGAGVGVGVGATSSFSSTTGTASRVSTGAGPVISYKTPTTGSFTTGSGGVRATHRTSATHTDGFQLHQYDASENRGKYGYVLTFDS